MTFAPGDSTRLYIPEQTGRIRIIRDGELLTDPFLNIAGLISNGGERGLLGLAFHPDFWVNHYFYVNYTNTAGDTVIARYTVLGPDQADADSAQVVLGFDQPFANHNGGWLAFGPDGYLYIASGDGGFRDDPTNQGQNKDSFLGKILRIDVDGDDFPLDPVRNYAIPPDNPFVGTDGLDEIWAFGLRNPWRCSFDPGTGDLYIGDVGQDAQEEIDFQPANSTGGENYGWRCMEGTHCTGFSGCTCNAAELTLPIHTYSHSDPLYFHCAVTGGEVYRGTAIPDLAGTYFFADFCSHRIWSFRDGPLKTDFQDRTAELQPCHGKLGAMMTLENIASFGRDGAGELYLCDLLGGEVFKIAADLPVQIVDSVPPELAIDARRPVAVGGVEYSTWTSFQLRFDQPSGCLSKADFAVEVTGGSNVPTVGSATTQTSNPYVMTVALSGGVEATTWLTIRHGESGTAVTVGSLPGDVDQSGVTAPLDLLELSDKLNGAAAVGGEWTYDIDDSTALTPGDVEALIGVLDGSGLLQAYLGAGLPVLP